MSNEEKAYIDGMTEYTIVGLKEVREIIQLLLPYLRLKKVLVKSIITLIDTHPEKRKMDAKELLRLSMLVDKTATFNYSKKRTNTSEVIKAFLKDKNLIPVET